MDSYCRSEQQVVFLISRISRLSVVESTTIVCIGGVLTASELATLQERLATAECVDGQLTAGWHAKQVKNNQQLSKGSPVAVELTESRDTGFGTQ